MNKQQRNPETMKFKTHKACIDYILNNNLQGQYMDMPVSKFSNSFKIVKMTKKYDDPFKGINQNPWT